MATTEVANKIKYGFSDVYYAKLNTDGTYATPVNIPGAVSVSLKSAGSTLTAYGDNVAQADFQINQGYTGSISFNLIPDQFKTDILGETVDESGVIFESSDIFPCEFALLFQFLGDKYNRRGLFYRCKAGRPDIASVTIRPLANGNLAHKVKAAIKDTEATHSIYSNWFTHVYGFNTLTVTSVAGSTTGTTVLTVTPVLTNGNSYMYKTAATITVPAYGDVCDTTAGYIAWDGSSEITATTGNRIVVVEVDSSFKAINIGSTTVVSE